MFPGLGGGPRERVGAPERSPGLGRGSLELGGGPRVSQGLGGGPRGLGGGPTSRWGRVKTTGSMRKTRLDSLLMEAAMTWELTTRGGARAPTSPPSRTVAFSVERNSPRLL